MYASSSRTGISTMGMENTLLSLFFKGTRPGRPARRGPLHRAGARGATDRAQAPGRGGARRLADGHHVAHALARGKAHVRVGPAPAGDEQPFEPLRQQRAVGKVIPRLHGWPLALAVGQAGLVHRAVSAGHHVREAGAVLCVLEGHDVVAEHAPRLPHADGRAVSRSEQCARPGMGSARASLTKSSAMRSPARWAKGAVRGVQGVEAPSGPSTPAVVDGDDPGDGRAVKGEPAWTCSGPSRAPSEWPRTSSAPCSSGRRRQRAPPRPRCPGQSPG